ncbi:MAG: GFA family protein [Pseudomonadota bacterium]
MPDMIKGRCFCGSIRFELELPLKWSVACHCESCRRQCSAPMTAYVGVSDGQWRFLGDAPSIHHSSPGVERRFCGTCGSPLTFQSDKMTGLMHFYVAALEDPEAFPPQVHVAAEERLCWFDLPNGIRAVEGPRVPDDAPPPTGGADGVGI